MNAFERFLNAFERPAKFGVRKVTPSKTRIVPYLIGINQLGPVILNGEEPDRVPNVVTEQMITGLWQPSVHSDVAF